MPGSQHDGPSDEDAGRFAHALDPQGNAQTSAKPLCSSVADLAGAETDLAYRVELAAIAAVVHDRVAYLNQPGLKQSGTLGFGNVGASMTGVIYSRGKNPNGRSDIEDQFDGFSPDGIASGVQGNITRALNSPVGSADCNKLLDAIGAARNFLLPASPPSKSNNGTSIEWIDLGRDSSSGRYTAEHMKNFGRPDETKQLAELIRRKRVREAVVECSKQ